MLRFFILLFFLLMTKKILATGTNSITSAAVNCQLPSITTDIVSNSIDNSNKSQTGKQSSIDIAYIRLTLACFDDGINDSILREANERSRWSISAKLSLIRPPGQKWPPTPEATVNNVHFALAILNGLLPRPTDGHRSSVMHLRRLSLAGLPLPGNAVSTRLMSALTKFSHLTHLNLSSIGATSFSSELLSLTRLRSLLIGDNPIDCLLNENLWIQQLTRLGSRLFESTTDAMLLRCQTESKNSSNSSGATKLDVGLSSNVTELDVSNGSPLVHTVDLYSRISLPCSRRFFRIGDVGIWTPEVKVTWRRLEPTGGSGLLLLQATGTNYTLSGGNGTISRVWHYKQQQWHSTTRVEIGPMELGAPLIISEARSAAVGLWRCEFAKAGSVLGARHRLVLKPPLEELELNCYILAACTSVAMVLIGLVAALMRCLVRTRCCTRVVHIVEAQSVHNLDASPLQTRRRRQAAAEDVAKADGDEVHPWLQDDFGSVAAASGTVAMIDGPSCSGVAPGGIGASGLRDRLRDINNQMRLRATNFGETVGSSVRAGWSNGVEHVKGQMRSMAEFCGVANPPLGQTVSVVSVHTDPEGRQEPMECHLHLLSSV